MGELSNRIHEYAYSAANEVESEGKAYITGVNGLIINKMIFIFDIIVRIRLIRMRCYFCSEIIL